MTKMVIITVIAGMFSGYFFMPESVMGISENILIVGLCILLFFVGIDIGHQGTVVQNFKKVGFRVIIFPIAVIIGTMAGAAVGALFLPVTLRESLAVGAGFGWYSLAPVILTKYSAELSAISFMHNVFREVLGIMLIPIVAKRIGYIETTSLPGAAAMDVCLPIVERATNADIAVYSFVSGVVLSFAVPILVPLIAGV
ncbi:MAG: lysine exporter LysO family protein [Anaerovoracaceae bacterium]